MKTALCTLFFAGACLATQAGAAPAAKAEVAHLLAAVEQSQCQFKRNGSWHDAREARAHLQKKYDYLEKKQQVPDAESFIERAAARSSTSGQAYQIQCKDAKPVASATWFSEELARYRKAAAKP